MPGLLKIYEILSNTVICPLFVWWIVRAASISRIQAVGADRNTCQLQIVKQLRASVIAQRNLSISYELGSLRIFTITISGDDIDSTPFLYFFASWWSWIREKLSQPIIQARHSRQKATILIRILLSDNRSTFYSENSAKINSNKQYISNELLVVAII